MTDNGGGKSAGETIGFVGLGKMGQPMVRCLAKAGHRLRLNDIDQAIGRRMAEEVGGVDLPSPAELAKGAGVVILMVPNSRIVEEVCLAGDTGLINGLSAGALIIDMSSSDPSETRRLGSILKERGILLVDAPVSGGVRKAVTGTLAIMAGSDDEAAYERAVPILKAMGSVLRAGGLGSGHAVKALNNYVSAAGLAAACEAVLVAQSFGVDPGVLTDIINASTGRNNSTENKIKPFVLSGDFQKAGFALDLMSKDVATAANLAERLNLPLPGLIAANALWKAAAAQLGQGSDHTEIFRYLSAVAQQLHKPDAERPRRQGADPAPASPSS